MINGWMAYKNTEWNLIWYDLIYWTYIKCLSLDILLINEEYLLILNFMVTTHLRKLGQEQQKAGKVALKRAYCR